MDFEKNNKGDDHLKKDVKTKEFLRKPENFADAFNYFLYNGEQVIGESNLVEKDAEELIFIGGSKSGAGR